MSKGKKYFLKMPEGFFQDKRTKRLLRAGHSFVTIYLKMLCRSLASDGYLRFEGVDEDLAEEIAYEIDEEPEDVAETIKLMIKIGLATGDDKEIFLPELESMTASESSDTQRKRDYRSRKKLEEDKEEDPAETDDKPPAEEPEVAEADIKCRLGKQIITKAQYEELVKLHGEEAVDVTIRRIVDHPYWGLLTPEKIGEWAKEYNNPKRRENGPVKAYRQQSTKFSNYQQREIDYDAMLSEHRKQA